MKNNQPIAVLVGILFITTLVTCFLLFRFYMAHNKLQQLEGQLNTTRAFVQAISADVIEYSKKDPGIDPILKSFNLIPGTPAPAGKPATR